MGENDLPKYCSQDEIVGKTISKWKYEEGEEGKLLVLFTDNTYSYLRFEFERYCDAVEMTQLGGTGDSLYDSDYRDVLLFAGIPETTIVKLLSDKKQRDEEGKERAEYERLKAKFG